MMTRRRRLNRRDLLKWAGLGLLAGAASTFGPAACSLPRPGDEAGVDHFSHCVRGCRQGAGRSLLACVVNCLPELQIQPRPISSDSLQQRLQLAQAVAVELAGMPVAEIVEQVFPLKVRYPAWLVAGISVELFELVLGNSALPEFELEGWAFEHVLPHTASIDQALAPLCELLHDPQAAFSAELEAGVAAQIEALRGRLVLFGDESLVAMAETIRQVLAQGEQPALLRLAVTVGEGEAPFFQASPAEELASTGLVAWNFNSTAPDWAKVVRKNVRAIDKVAGSGLLNGLLLRCLD